MVIASKVNVPFLMNKPGMGHQIEGDIYEINEAKLAHLDILEDYPKLYLRRPEKIMVTETSVEGVKSGQMLECIVYFLTKEKPVMLEMPFLKNYSSNGDHGKPYQSGYEVSKEELYEHWNSPDFK